MSSASPRTAISRGSSATNWAWTCGTSGPPARSARPRRAISGRVERLAPTPRGNHPACQQLHPQQGLARSVLGGPRRTARRPRDRHRRRRPDDRTRGRPAGSHVDLRGRTSLPELVAAIAAADLFIAPDTGPMHIAGAVAVPAVVIYGGYMHPNSTAYPGISTSKPGRVRPMLDGRALPLRQEVPPHDHPGSGPLRRRSALERPRGATTAPPIPPRRGLRRIRGTVALATRVSPRHRHVSPDQRPSTPRVKWGRREENAAWFNARVIDPRRGVPRNVPGFLELPRRDTLDFIGNKEYDGLMVTYERLQTHCREFLALTGLTLSEFQLLLTVFPQAYQRLYPTNQTSEGQPRQRSAGGGCKGLLHRPEDKLLFILVYLKTYPLQVVMCELFGLSQPQVNYWIHRLLPVLQEALDDLGVCPERHASHFAQSQAPSEAEPRLIIDGTERGGNGQKALKNRPCTTAARRKRTPTRTSSS